MPRFPAQPKNKGEIYFMAQKTNNVGVAQPSTEAGPDWLNDVAGYLNVLGSSLQSVDENTTGADDKAGRFLVFGGDIITSIQEGDDLPAFPEDLVSISGKLTPAARIWLTMAIAGIAQTENKTRGKARTALRYIKQGLLALSAGRQLPPIPDTLN